MPDALDNTSLVELCRATGQAARDALAWFDENPDKIRQESASLGREFRKFAYTAQKLAVAAARPMCVGVFGPSQAGKSYLISALARKGANRVAAVFGDRKLDFVSEVNPEGGNESTGIVTRFTMKPFGAPAATPVSLRLLSQSDLVKIIGNTSLADFDIAADEPPSQDRINQVLAELERSAQQRQVDTLHEDDVWDLQEYFEQRFRGRPTIQTLIAAHFWPRAAALAPRLDGPARARLFALLWNEVEPFTKLYARLLEALRQLNFTEDAFCALDALTRPGRKSDIGTDVDPRDGSVIDVRTLYQLMSADDDRLEVVTQSGARAQLRRSEITALVAELTIHLAEEPWPFFRHTDLLDFPGARSRETYKDKEADASDPAKLPHLFLRGKVDYLFQRYCAEQELTSMLLCVGGSIQEVKTLPGMIRDWIDVTHGATPEARLRQATALFFVLTKFDMEFMEKAGQSENPDSKWTTRLHASFIDFFAKSDAWPLEWHPGVPFKNLFWLRNPNAYADHIIEFGPDKVETGLRKDKQEAIERYRVAHHANELVRRHFEDPERAWNEAFKLNDGGISYIAERLAPVCNPELKKVQIQQRAATLRREMAERLKRFYVSGDLQAELDKRIQRMREAGRHLIRCASEQRFGRMLQRLQIDYDVVVNIYRRLESGLGAPDAKSGQPGVALGKRSDLSSMFEALQLEEAQAEFTPAATDQADVFADQVLTQWITLVQANLDVPDLLQDIAMPREPMAVVTDEIIEGARRLDLRTAIAGEVRQATAFRQKAAQGVAKPAMIAQRIISGYVTGLGFDKVPPAQRPLVAKTQRPVFGPRPPINGMPPLGDEPTPYEQTFYVDWITALMRLVEDNVRMRRGQAVDMQANTKMQRILGTLQIAA